MKKCLFLIVATIMVQSCAKDSAFVESTNTSDQVVSTFVTPDMAIEEVEKFLMEVEGTRTGSNRRVDSIYATGSGDGTRNGDAVNDTPLVYVVNFEDEQGYAIVSGDTRMQPILMLTDSGSLPEGAVIENPGTVIMLSLIETEYKMKLGMPIEDNYGNIVNPIGVTTDGMYVYPNMNYEGELLDPNTNITPNLSVWSNYITYGEELGCEWGQSIAPYNTYTYTEEGEKAPAGCVAAAVAQIMYFWGHNFTYNGRTFDWDLMRNHTSIYNPYPNAYDMIAELYYQLGLPANLNMDYDVDGSGAYDTSVPRTFENFGYTSGGNITPYNLDEIMNVISTRPVYVSGCSLKITEPIFSIFGIEIGEITSYDRGHAWVIDQVMQRSRFVYKDAFETRAIVKETQYLVHCNWGWNGYNNGYYHSGIFNTNEGPVDVTRSTEGEKYYYKYSLDMNTGIYL